MAVTTPNVIEVTDAFCAWNDGRWRVGDGGVERTRSRRDWRLGLGETEMRGERA